MTPRKTPAARPRARTARAAADPAVVPATRRTVVIESVAPAVDGGRYAVKREVGDRMEVSADIFREGHEVLAAFVRYRPERETAWREAPMQLVDNDRWAGEIAFDAIGRWVFAIEALTDAFRSWLADLTKRLEQRNVIVAEALQAT